jgi:hypothetical protein
VCCQRRVCPAQLACAVKKMRTTTILTMVMTRTVWFLGHLQAYTCVFPLPYLLCVQVLSYLDFFPSGVQRVAVATAANVCNRLSADAAPMVQDAIPILTNLLMYQVQARLGPHHACLRTSPRLVSVSFFRCHPLLFLVMPPG